MSVRVEHIGVWVADIDRVAAFYAKYFDARIGELYRNPRSGRRCARRTPARRRRGA